MMCRLRTEIPYAPSIGWSFLMESAKNSTTAARERENTGKWIPLSYVAL